MKYQKPINTVQNSDEFSSGLMEAYGKWMGGDCFQNTQPVDIYEAFDGMDPQSNGAEIEDTTKKKKTAKKGGYVGQESAPKNEELMPEELVGTTYEIEMEDGEVIIIEKVKMDGKDDNGFKSCWKGYKKAGTKVKGGKEVNNCVKAGFEPEGDDLQEKAPPGEKYERMVKHVKKGYSKDGELSKKEKGIAYATAWKAKNKAVKEGLDPVGKEDGDIDNDGDKDKSDKYLHARRKKIGKILAMKKKSGK